MKKINLSGLSRSDLDEFFNSIGEKQFRTNQVFSWIHKHQVQSFDEMTNLSRSLRQKLNNFAYLENPRIIEIESSQETLSQKFLIEFSDGTKIESVFLPDNRRYTVCLSTQAGCPLDCRFCATGKMGFIRNLSVAEILSQLITIQRHVEPRITNVVFMGMGEPFLNYENVIKAAYMINDDFGFAIGARKITISTAGIIPKIIQFANEGHRFKLAFSLNASNEALRLKVMPITKKYHFEDCLKALEYYTQKTKRRVTLEYVLLGGFNDSDADAKRLIKITNRLKCKLNVIPYNPISEVDYRRPTDEELHEFVQKVLPSKSAVTVRRSQGADINAACGQLYTEVG